MVHLLLPPEVFYNQLISDKMDMQDHYLAWRQSHNNDHRSPAGMGPFSFCSFPFLLNAKAKTRLLQVRCCHYRHRALHAGQQWRGLLTRGTSMLAPSRIIMCGPFAEQRVH